ncbi:MAG: DinB family protein [Gemmatimonadaceae bacterium]
MNTRAELIATYASAPERLRAAVLGLTEEQLTTPRAEGKWSTHQIAVHLADSELHAALRVRRLIAEPGTEFQMYDQATWARELTPSTSIVAAVDAFALARRMTTETLLAVTSEQWAHICTHPERGPMGLDQMLEILAWHGDHHIDQILQLRAQREW